MFLLILFNKFESEVCTLRATNAVFHSLLAFQIKKKKISAPISLIFLSWVAAVQITKEKILYGSKFFGASDRKAANWIRMDKDI